jgi:formiminotetrahydrofolate cyclodeaminase
MKENVEAFLRVLDPTDNSTGGGTASAVAGAMAAALVAMVARLSIGKEGLEPESFYRGLIAEAEALSAELFDGGLDDSEAFMGVRAAYRLDKDTDEKAAARREAIQKATLQAANVPLANMERCWRVLELAMSLKGHSNPNAASDLECAMHLGRAGLLGCADNVEINLSTIADREVAKALAERAGSIKALAFARLPTTA